MPDAALAAVSFQKITAYLLSEIHPTGRHKCQFFKSFGFSAESPEHFADVLKRHAANNLVVKTVHTDFGTRYIVECSIRSPDGHNPCIVSVWQVGPDGLPALITAYPK